ncbi:MAG: carbohydrate ABC transporter permease [Lachnospiraceae bacterium]|nr:carbohydrate ABC transporter permease [Lachnospiraceae bacterium]
MARPGGDADTASYSAEMFRHKLIRNIVCIFFCILSILPFLLMIINATRTSNEIKTGITLIPGGNFMKNLNMLNEKQNGMAITLWKAMRNSLIITIPSTLCTIYFSSATAYGIHVYQFKLKKFAWAFIMAVMMVPTQITIIGFYRFMLKLNLVDNYLALILPTIAAPTVVFFMKQYMESVLSLEMIEAARIDGANEFRIFNTIIVPIMKPAMATQAIFAFVASWNNLFTPTILITSDAKKTLPMFVQLLTSDQFRVDYGVVYMGLFVTVIPLIIAYIFFARFIVAGVTLGGVKG